MESIPPVIKPPVSRGRWLIHLMLIAGYVLTLGLLGWVRRETHPAALSQTVLGLLLTCATQLFIFGIIFGLACLASRATRDDLRLRWKGRIMPVLLGVGYSVALRFAVGILMVAIGIALAATGVMTADSFKEFVSSNRPGVDKVIDVSAMQNNPVYFWLTLTVLSFVVAGLTEELWRAAFLAGMRGLWPKQFGSRAGQVVAVFICAIIFGVGHLAMGPLAVCLAGLLGVGLGLIMVFHGSIWPAVIAHGFFDATSMAMIPWVMSQTT